MRKIAAALAAIMAVLVLFASCEGNPQPSSGTVDTLTVYVGDGTDTKSIGYTGTESGFESDGSATSITDYKIYVFSGATVPENLSDNLVKASDFLDSSNTKFQITNVTTGYYSFYVEGYIKKNGAGDSNLTGDNFYEIASGKKENVYISPTSASVTVNVDTFPTDVKSGTITVDLTLPVDLINLTGEQKTPVLEGDITWSIRKVNDLSTDLGTGYSGTVTDDTVNAAIDSASVSGEYHYTLTIPGVDPGMYVLTVTATDNVGEAKRGAYCNADSLRLLPGLPATGKLSLDSLKPSSYEFSVIDKIGSEIEVTVTESDMVYEIEEGDEITIALSKALAANQVALWYVDGVAASPTTSDNTNYLFADLASGIRNITGVVYDSTLKAAVGSVSVRVDVPRTVNIGPVTG